ncbi:hypothetical protein PC123_g9067 [Phytophthora cactorum]|nr:hypothetical protein PC123_g9067 [Phytophthora cactorum]
MSVQITGSSGVGAAVETTVARIGIAAVRGVPLVEAPPPSVLTLAALDAEPDSVLAISSRDEAASPSTGDAGDATASADEADLGFEDSFFWCSGATDLALFVRFGALRPLDFEREEAVLGRAPLEEREGDDVWQGVVLMVLVEWGFLGKIETELRNQPLP